MHYVFVYNSRAMHIVQGKFPACLNLFVVRLLCMHILSVVYV